MKTKKLLSSEKGNILPIMAAMLLVLVAVAGVVIDSGLIIEGKIKLHSATKIAAGETIQAYDRDIWESQRKVVLDRDLAEQIAKQYLSYNLPEATIKSITVSDDSPNKAVVTTSLKVEFIFMKIFGINDCVVESTVSGVGG